MHIQEEAQHASEGKWAPKNKARGKNSSLKRYLRKKQRNVIDERKVSIMLQNTFVLIWVIFNFY